jgi:hypothetical protein
MVVVLGGYNSINVISSCTPFDWGIHVLWVTGIRRRPCGSVSSQILEHNTFMERCLY